MNSFRPCILIPNYNHSRGFAQWIARMLPHGLPIIVVNDGSNAETTALLRQLDDTHPTVEVVHLPKNGGKGHAVKTGLHHAAERGFTHALQVDADGQHDLDDLPRFLTISHANPHAVVCGRPVYDESVPRHRKLCRYITHCLVWFLTLSFDIRDSMCGYRIYPLQETCRVLNRHQTGDRMDFDIEVLVRMFWDGLQMRWLPTAVTYPENGLSNYRLWADNCLLAVMYVRLLLAMVPRIPLLLFRRNPQQQGQHWASVAESGSSWGLGIMFAVYRYLGRGFYLALLRPVALYYVLTNTTARRASRQYLQQLAIFQNRDPVVSWRMIYAHMYAFGVSSIDKIVAWSDEINRSDVTFHGEPLFHEILDSGRGALLIGSHHGNLELCRAMGEKGGKFRINAIVFNKNALKFQQILRKAAPNIDMNLIHVENMGIDTAILLKEKVDAGEIVIITGDRVSIKTASRVVMADFLGRPAPFAEGPFILAGLLDCPVYLIFCLNEQGRYHVYLERFARKLKFPRAERRKQLAITVQRYASRLNHYVARAPLQWFNFYDFWHVEHQHPQATEHKEDQSAELQQGNTQV